MLSFYWHSSTGVYRLVEGFYQVQGLCLVRWPLDKGSSCYDLLGEASLRYGVSCVVGSVVGSLFHLSVGAVVVSCCWWVGVLCPLCTLQVAPGGGGELDGTSVLR